MSVVADLSVPTTDFALCDSLAAAPEVDVEFERVVTHSQEWVMPFLWVSGEDLPAFEQAIHDDETVAEATVSSEFDGATLFRVEWSDHVQRTVNAIFDQKGTLVEAVGSEGRWELTVRFDEHHSLSTLQSHFEEADVGFDVERVYTPTEPRQPEFDVTPAQRDALVAALEADYFEVPREATIADIAERLDISQNAVSERLRRGMANLVAAALTVRGSLSEDSE